MNRIVILGSTGSIGTQTLDVVDRLAGRVQVVGLAAHTNARLLAEQAKRFHAGTVCLVDEHADAAPLDALTREGVRVLRGLDGMDEIAALDAADAVVVAVAGAVGIRPTHAALQAGKHIALASKEVLVATGETTMRLASERGCRIVPIDSEHSAVFQCLQGAPVGAVERIMLTASGGPFRTWTAGRMSRVTPAQALHHPTWTMGGLVTINSATLMNKGLEVIEARWLFGVDATDIEVIVHPQSIIHSMVRFHDGSVVAQIGLPDMRHPIQYALLHPERVDTGLPRIDMAQCGGLTFEAPDAVRFPALVLARSALESGGTMPAVMNAANEAAVALFLAGRIGYRYITATVEDVMAAHNRVEPTLDNVLEADAWARRHAMTVNGVGSYV